MSARSGAVMEPGSVMINTSSEAAKSPMPQHALYAATKAAVMNMSLSLAQLLISQGIRVNAVLPGSTWTPLIVTAVDAEGQEQEGGGPTRSIRHRGGAGSNKYDC